MPLFHSRSITTLVCSPGHPPDPVGARRWRPAMAGLIGAALLAHAAGAAGAAEPKAASSAESLDEQVQAIKSDVLAIAAELENLEERLLYPSGTQVAVFVAVEGEAAEGLDSARVSIDGEPLAHHVYTWKELEALRRGGVQRLYTGNVRTGEHRIEVELRGRHGDTPFELREVSTFEKQKAPARVGLTLRPRLGDAPALSIEAW